MGIKASVLMMIIYAAFTFVLLMSGAKYFALIFVDPSETEILLDTELFLHILHHSAYSPQQSASGRKLISFPGDH